MEKLRDGNRWEFQTKINVGNLTFVCSRFKAYEGEQYKTANRFDVQLEKADGVPLNPRPDIFYDYHMYMKIIDPFGTEYLIFEPDENNELGIYCADLVRGDSMSYEEKANQLVILKRLRDSYQGLSHNTLIHCDLCTEEKTTGALVIAINQFIREFNALYPQDKMIINTNQSMEDMR